MRQVGQFLTCDPQPMGHDTFRIDPVTVGVTAEKSAAKKHLNLMEPTGWVVKFIDQARVAHGDLEPAFFHDLAREVFRQAGVVLGAPTRGTPEPRVAFPCIHNQELVVVEDEGAGGNAGHWATMICPAVRRKVVDSSPFQLRGRRLD